MARSERGASPPRRSGTTSERRRQPPFCLAPGEVASILALAGVARLAEIVADIGTALAPWPAPKSTETRPTPVSQQSLNDRLDFLFEML